MAKSDRTFDRWIAHDKSTWTLQVFKKHHTELIRLLIAQSGGRVLAYRHLKNTGAKWEDLATTHFAGSLADPDTFTDLRDWSTWYNNFDNWVNLSAVTTLASNLETYVASVAGLALDSDPGVLFGAPKSMDGAYVRKAGGARPAQVESLITACTKGAWGSRIAALERLFGTIPTSARKLHAELEEIRGIRNRFGHAFGRDIDESRKHGQIEIAAMETVTHKRLGKLSTATWNFAREIDRYLLAKHIGDFEAVNFYAELFPSQLLHVPAGQRAMNFKKSIGKFGANPRGKIYCKGLVTYWETL